jgi:hypothetical protein
VQEVFTLIIDHRYGFDCTVYSSYEKAKSYLYKYITLAWDLENKELPIGLENKELPIDHDAAIFEYFKMHTDKYWEISKHMIDQFAIKEEKHENL